MEIYKVDFCGTINLDCLRGVSQDSIKVRL